MLPKLIFYLTILVLTISSESIEKPHIIFIVADDLGWNDLSCHGSDQIPTPNIDMIGYEGIMLQNYYTDSLGTPSRSALFTGKYAFRHGSQGNSISAGEDRGVPVSERLLPSYLRELGYATHLIGKWGLGKSRPRYLPTNRGFDTFYGYLDSSVDYYTYNHVETWNGTDYCGLGLFHDMDPVEDQSGHLTEVLTNRAVQVIRKHNTSVPLYLHLAHAAPHAGGGLVNLQTPEETITTNEHIAHSARRLYAGLVTGLDKSVGNIVAALAEREILDNTMIVFVSDNGAAPVGDTRNFGSNFPLRGTKGSPWEGGVRSTGIIWRASITSQIYRGLFHVTDWLPTLMAVAGGNEPKTIDGINQWNAIKNDEQVKRKQLLLTVDDLNGCIALIEGHYKIIIGNVDNNTSGYYGKELKALRQPAPEYESKLFSSETARVFKETLELYLNIDATFSKREQLTIFFNDSNSQDQDLCVPSQEKGCLFNITADPKEANDLWLTAPEVVKHMTLSARYLWAQLKPRHAPKFDPRSNPVRRHYVWGPWLDDDDKLPEPLNATPSFPLRISVGEMQYLVDLNLNTFSESMNAYVKKMADSFVENVGRMFKY